MQSSMCKEWKRLIQAAQKNADGNGGSLKPVHLLLALAKHRGCTAALLRSREGFLSIDQAMQLELADDKNGEDDDVFDQEQLLFLANRAQRCCADEAKCLLDALLSISCTSVERVLSLCGIDAALLHKTIRLPQMRSSSDKSRLRIVERYAIDLTELAQNGELDAISGREEELQRLQTILCRRRKNNPCLVGEPGVGKSAIAEALAQRIAGGDVLPMLKNKRLLMLDISSVVAGTKYRGDFEQRMNEIIAELESADDCILFIDELHCIVGAGSSEGSVDAANLLKPALARGRIQLIGATTRKEYTKHIEKDSALERRFLPVYVDEPSEHQAAKMLLRASAKLQLHHRIFIPKELIDRAVALSVRYLPQRRLPDKALDLLDEAAAHCRTKECTERCCTLSEADLVSVISKWSGVRDIAAFGSNKKLRELNSTLQQHIVGQQHALSVLCEALQRRNSGLADSNRPIGCFLFCGPTGVGKTECARVLANSYFGTDALLRFDMSEYSDITAVSRLIGANAGYVGHEEDGQLTEAVRKKPFCVLLMDEIEKADPSVRQLLLQIMDCGKLTDAKGRAADFRNCIFILTCNTAATLLQRGGGIGFAQGECAAQAALQRELQKQFSAEFLARLDEAVPFYPLSESHTQQICIQKCEALCSRAKKLGLVLKVDRSAVQLLCQKSRCEQNGARDIARNISRYIELPAAKLLLNRDKESRDAVCITAVNGEFVMLGVQDQLRSCLSTEVPASSAAPITVMTSSGSM